MRHMAHLHLVHLDYVVSNMHRAAMNSGMLTAAGAQDLLKPARLQGNFGRDGSRLAQITAITSEHMLPRRPRPTLRRGGSNVSIDGRFVEDRPRMRQREEDYRVMFEVANLGIARADLAANRCLGSIRSGARLPGIPERSCVAWPS